MVKKEQKHWTKPIAAWLHGEVPALHDERPVAYIIENQ